MSPWTPVAMRRYAGSGSPVTSDPEPLMLVPPTVAINSAAPGSRKQWVNATPSLEGGTDWLVSFAPLTGAGLVDPVTPVVARAPGIGWAGTGADTRQPDPDRTYVKTKINETQVNQAQAHGQFKISVIHTGTWLRLNTWSRGGAFRVRVDGELAMLESIPLGGNLTNRSINVEFAGSATRKVDFELYHGVYAYGLSCGATDTIATPDAPEGKSLYIIGDSFSDGAQSTSKGFRDMAHLCAARLGIEDVIMDGLGGTGYVKTNGGAGTPPWENYLDRIVNNVGDGKVEPDVMLVIGSVNDKFATQGEVFANSQAFYDLVDDLLPGVPVYVAVFGENVNNNANLAGRYAQMGNACAAAPNVAGFLNLMSILTGTGHAGNPKGDGTRDLWLHSDLTHPTLLGHLEYGRQLAEFLEPEFV